MPFRIIISLLITTFLMVGCTQPAVNLVTSKHNMKLTSLAFEHEEKLPQKYTCDGLGVNPPLTISDVPVDTQSLALIMEDPDAPSGLFVHWLVWNLDPKLTEIKEDGLPAGAEEGTTSYGKSGYGLPCPPSGSHHYVFRLYALDIMLDLSSSDDKRDLERAMAGHILDQAELVGVYR